MKKEHFTGDCLAVHSMGLVGIEIYDIEHGFDEYVYWIYTGDTVPIYHRSKVYINVSGESYFLAFGRRVYLNDCLRVDVA